MYQNSKNNNAKNNSGNRKIKCSITIQWRAKDNFETAKCFCILLY